MRFLIENDNLEKYYRLEVEGMGSFYHAIEKIVKKLLKSEDDEDYELGLEIDGLSNDLTAALPYPENIKYKNIKFAYTQKGYNEMINVPSYLTQNESASNDLRERLIYAGYHPFRKEVNPDPDKIVYRDDYQIGYIE